jgi:hypothetical protein
VPRARLNSSRAGRPHGRAQALRAYQRRALAADALIASCYLARVRRALAAVFGGAVGKDTECNENRHAWPDAALSRGALYSTTTIEMAAIFA